MNNYFEKDITKMHILKKAFYVTLVSSLTLLITSAMSLVGLGIGKIDKACTESLKKDAIVEIQNSDEYKSAKQICEEKYSAQFANGEITKAEYNNKIAYLSSEEYMDTFNKEAKLVEKSEKIKTIEEGEENIKVVAPTFGLSGAVLAGATYGIHKKREQVKSRWFTKEEGRDL